MSDTVETPESFDVLSLCGTLYWIDRAARREIEDFLRSRPSPLDTITIDDLNGSEVLVIADAVNSIWHSTPEVRSADRAIRKMLEAEEAEI